MTNNAKKALLAFLKSERKGLGRGEYASGFRRAVDRAVEAVEAVTAGRVYDSTNDRWVYPADPPSR